MTEPAVAAARAIIEIMQVGSAKDGCDESWRDKQPRYHLLKAIRHATTHLMQAEGVTAPDDENHLRLALTRLAMALAQEDLP